MEVGDLVRGTTNQLMGIVTKVSIGSKVHVRVYWFGIDLYSTGWIRTDGLEAL